MLIGYDGNGYDIGDRVEIHPGTDHWMRGARYGVVAGTAPTPEDRVRFRLDETGDRLWAGPADLLRRSEATMDPNETTEAPLRHDLGKQAHAYRRDAGGWNVFGAGPYGIALSDDAVRELHRPTEMYNKTTPDRS